MIVVSNGCIQTSTTTKIVLPFSDNEGKCTQSVFAFFYNISVCIACISKSKNQ